MDKIYGPYQRGSDKRWIIIVNGKTVSYPKYLYEKHHNVQVIEPMTVDHIDGNPQNNNIENLRLLTRKQNAQEGSYTGRTMITLICAYCTKEFNREKRFAPRKSHWLAYCSTDCRDASK